MVCPVVVNFVVLWGGSLILFHLVNYLAPPLFSLAIFSLNLLPWCLFPLLGPISGSGQETRSWPPGRAPPTPQQQLALYGEEGECVCLLYLRPLTLCVSNKCVELRCGDPWEILSRRAPFGFTLACFQVLQTKMLA